VILKEQKNKAVSALRALFDEGSFAEIGGGAGTAALAGFGGIGGRLAHAWALSGAVDAACARKISKVYESALKTGSPVIAALDSDGSPLDAGAGALSAYGEAFAEMSRASGVVPQIAAVLGGAVGAASYIAELSDVVIISKENGRLLLSPPSVAAGKDALVTLDKAGGWEAALAGGAADLAGDNGASALAAARAVLGYFPQNNMEEPPEAGAGGGPNRLISRERRDFRGLIKDIADAGSYLELKETHAPSVITALVRLNGGSAGIIGADEALSAEGIEKAAGFVSLLDAFNIPIVIISRLNAYEGSLSERRSAAKYGARLVCALSAASVPKAAFTAGPSSGVPHLLFSAGADLAYAWEGAGVSLLPEGAEAVTGAPNPASFDGFDAVIKPEETRKFAIAALEALRGKRVSRPPRKHGSKLI
jgi:acetyl-CoA carboxylase carboxyltransferase component